MKILVLANFGMGLYKFRKELLEELIFQGHEVYISLPRDEYIPSLEKIGCKFISTQLDRRGTSPISDLKLLLEYIKIIKRVKPQVVLTYTIKPNIYGGIASMITKTHYISNITGLGTAVENKGLVQKISLLLYKIALQKSSCVFFQNKANKKLFEESKLVKGKTRLLPGSGVNVHEHRFEKYPLNDGDISFLFIGRVMKAKGIEEYLKVAELVKKEYPNSSFSIVGGIEEDYLEEINKSSDGGIINYYGQQTDVHSFIKNAHAIVLPSYHEGLANVLLEAASSGRPILASEVPGCAETFDEGLTGIGFKAKQVDSLADAITKFINLPYEEKVEMGIKGRRKIEKTFNRNIVIDAYLQEITITVEKGNSNETIRDVGK